MRNSPLSGKKIAAGLLLALCLVTACGEKHAYVDTARGPFLCRKKSVYKWDISPHTGGRNRWFSDGYDVFVNQKKFAPPDYPTFVEDLASCSLSPNPAVQTMIFYNVDYDRGGIYLLRYLNNQAVLTRASQESSRSEGTWTNDGRWLLFRDFFVNVETGERKAIPRLPDDPDSYYTLIAIAPDRRTVVLFDNYDIPTHRYTLLFCDTETGAVQPFLFDLNRYPWLQDKSHSIDGVDNANHLWISAQFQWRKDATGKDVVVYPQAEPPVKTQ
ncbi:MAG: hypothetical protein NT075_08845 [Chloroflexi bacterium]|nr:hypothetical protein [Chloroflexota bacterium]